MSEQQVNPIHATIRERRTRKVISKNGPISLPHADVESCNRVVLDAIETAGFAPFHYSRNIDGVAEPWRFHVIWHEECRILAAGLPGWFPEMRPGNKLPGMLNACGALVLVNWLPQFESEEIEEKKVQVNEEHLAATATATQNLLLVLTAHGLGNYWSSGGFFRSNQMFKRLGINESERLLGAIFVDYGAPESEVEVIAGKQHAERSASSKWSQVIGGLNEIGQVGL